MREATLPPQEGRPHWTEILREEDAKEHGGPPANPFYQPEFEPGSYIDQLRLADDYGDPEPTE